METNSNILKDVKNIVFDLGNVICDIDFKRTVDAFQQLSGNDIDINLDNYMDHPVFGAIEKGEITPAEFRDRIREMLQCDVSDEKVDAAWAAVIVNTDMERLNLLKELGKSYRLFILSNTDEIHIRRVLKVVKEDFNINFTDLFEKCYYSHEMGMEKPGDEIYMTVMADAKIEAQETLFIDDKLDNIEAAKNLGIKTYHYVKENETLSSIF